MTPAFKSLVDQMPSLLEQLNACELNSIYPRKAFPKCPGIYALYEGRKAVYVGRSKNIWQRIGNHIGGRPEQSSFAFKLARDLMDRPATYKKEGSRKDLMEDKTFKLAFESSVDRVRSMHGRYVEIESEKLQHIFELYAALSLNTQYNQFGTS